MCPAHGHPVLGPGLCWGAAAWPHMDGAAQAHGADSVWCQGAPLRHPHRAPSAHLHRAASAWHRVLPLVFVPICRLLHVSICPQQLHSKGLGPPAGLQQPWIELILFPAAPLSWRGGGRQLWGGGVCGVCPTTDRLLPLGHHYLQKLLVLPGHYEGALDDMDELLGEVLCDHGHG